MEEIKTIIGNIVNYNDAFFGKINYNKQKIISVEKLSNLFNDQYNYILPGFIDSHTHGGYGLNFNDIDNLENKIDSYFNHLYSEGVIGVCATTITDSLENLITIGKKLNNINNSSLIGWHIEGPYISTEKKGAHKQELIKPASKEEIEKIINSFNKKPIIFTISPETFDYKSVFKNYINKNIFLSIGHSNCSANIAYQAIEFGCNRYTHLYNAMSVYSHRNPGIVNCALGVNKGYCEIISDGIHVDDFVINNTYNIVKPNRLIIVSDSLWVKGLDDDDYYWPNFDITKKGNVSYLLHSETLAGSNASYIDIVKHFKNTTNCSLNEIVYMTSYNVSISLNLQEKYGVIKNNASSSFTIVNNNLDILQTIVDGDIKYTKK